MKSQLILSRVLMVLFGMVALAAVLSAASDLSLISYLRDVVSGAQVDESRGDGIDLIQMLVSLVQFSLLLLTIVVFLVWFHGAHKNLVNSGLPRLRYSPGWAVGGFFVPFLNLVRPYQVMSEVWSGTAFLASDEKEELKSWQRVRVPGLVGFWWGLFLLNGIASRISSTLFKFAEEPSELLKAGWASFAANVVEVGAGILALLLVMRLSGLQEAAVRQRVDAGDGWPETA